MDAVFGDTNDEKIGVTVYDNNENKHRLLIGWDGNIKLHVTDEYPTDEANRTDEEEIIIQQVRKKALHTAHTETDADLLNPHWDPEVHERGIEALEQMPGDRFERLFADYYHALQEPPEDVALDQVNLVFLGTSLEGTTITEVGPIQYYIDGDSDEREWVGPNDEVYRNLAWALPMYEFDWSFGDRFREFLVHQLKCQIRDIYLNMGEDPPEEYGVDGHGKISINAFPAELSDRDA